MSCTGVFVSLPGIGFLFVQDHALPVRLHSSHYIEIELHGDDRGLYVLLYIQTYIQGCFAVILYFLFLVMHVGLKAT